MLIIVSHADEPIQEFNIESFPIVIGRGSDCDVVIASEHISRKHLEIQNREGKIFIRDLTLSNWVSYNDEKLSKSEYIQYFDFAPLVLPSGHEVNFQTSENEGLKMREGEQTSTNSKKVDIYANKVASTKVRHTKVQSESKSSQALIVLLVVIVGGYFAYDYFLSEDPQLKVRPQQVAVDKSQESTQPVPVAINRALLQKMLDTTKCQTAVMKPICDAILPTWNGGEGVVEFQNSLFVFKNFGKRLYSIFKTQEKLANFNLTIDKTYKVVAAERVLVSNFLEALNQRSVNQIYIVLFKEGAPSREIQKVFLVDTSAHLGLTQDDYRNAYFSVNVRGDLSVFEGKMGLLINEKTDIK